MSKGMRLTLLASNPQREEVPVMQHVEVVVDAKVKLRVAIENDVVDVDDVKEDVESNVADALNDYISDFSYSDATDAEIDGEVEAISFGIENVEYEQTSTSSEECGEVVAS